MENVKKQQYIVLGIISVILVIVIFLTVNAIINHQKDKPNVPSIKLTQVYSSDYLLNTIDNKYFFGSYEQNGIDVIIDSTGKEIYALTKTIYYDNIYKLKDGRYLIYKVTENGLVSSIFDGTKISDYRIIKDVSNIKPILYKGPEFDFLVGFYNQTDTNLTIYNIDNPDTIDLTSSFLLADNIIDNQYYINNENYLIIKNKDNKMGVIDFTGTTIIDYKYQNIIATENETFIAQDFKNRYGIVDKTGKTLLKFNYKAIKNYKDNYLVVNSSKELALYNSELKNITGFKMKYDSLLDYDLRNTNSLFITKLNGHLIVANNYLEDTNNILYTHHNLYVLNNDKVLYDINEIGFFYDTMLYTYDSSYTITIYDENYQELSKIPLNNVSKIESIKTISDDSLMITYLDSTQTRQTKYYNKSGVELDTNLSKSGTLYYSSYFYHTYLKEENNTQVLTFYSSNYESLATISGTTFKVCDEFAIVDNAIYKIEIS